MCSILFLFYDQADNDPNLHGKKKARKTTQAGGSGLDLTKIAAEQQAKLQKDKEELIVTNTTMPEKDAAASGERNTSASASGSGIGFSAGSRSGASSDIGKIGTDGQMFSLLSHRNKF